MLKCEVSSGAGPAADPAKGMGPLRIWPGGVANARVIGDLDASQGLLPSPAISQARTCRSGFVAISIRVCTEAKIL